MTFPASILRVWGLFVTLTLLPLAAFADSDGLHSLPEKTKNEPSAESGLMHNGMHASSVVDRIDETQSPETGTRRSGISPADLRLAPVLPGPRYISSRDMNENGWNSGLMNSISNSPGYAFLASAVVPGLGQAANRQWWKTAVFAAVEATALGIYIHRENRGRADERHYREYGNEHWSVVKYAQYIVENHEHQHGKSFSDLLNDGVEFNPEQEFGGIDPAFDIEIDWEIIDIQALREAERQSRFANGQLFSHDLPDYGSQQYYELMSKYFQYGPGWWEWDSNTHSIDEKNMPGDFLYHAQVGYDFNNDLSVARNMLTLTVINHFAAAFDAYFTQLLRDARMQPTASMEYGLRPTIGMVYRF